MATIERTVTQEFSFTQGSGRGREGSVSQAVGLSDEVYIIQDGSLEQSFEFSEVLIGLDAGQPILQSFSFSESIVIQMTWNTSLTQSIILINSISAYKVPWTEVGTLGTPTIFTIVAPLNQEFGHSISFTEIFAGEIA